MNLWNETKSIPISRQMVWEAYKKVRANKGSAGIDNVSMEEFDANRSKYLYKLWNRMASGSYFPPPVKEVEIPKKDGKVRKLGIPTINDRIGQMVVKMFIEPRLEKIFSNNSYGYRPNKNAHQALASVRENCWKTDWVIDLDMKNVSLKIDDSIFGETEKILSRIKKPRNRYINEAIEYYNRLQRRILLEKRLKIESELVKGDSMKVLKEFEEFDYVY